MPVSVLILTLNEEANLPRCLESLSWSDDIIVLDSFSTDRTVEIAQAAGAKVYRRQFDNWSAHQNWAVENIVFKHPWVYYSDADERVTRELAEEILSVTNDQTRKEVAYRVRFRNILFGRWIKRSSLYPTWVLRLFKPGKIRWERLVNPVAVVYGTEGSLKSHFLHYGFNRGLTEWFAKHNLYSQQEAKELLDQANKPLNWRALLSPQPASRRRALKQLAYRIPGRPLLLFLYLYLFRMGFLDGRAGLTYCILRAIYEYMIDIKLTELRRRNAGLPI